MAARLFNLMLCALLMGLSGPAAKAITHSENRVGGSPVFSSDFASQESAKPIGTPSENTGDGYDFASGTHKYLYTEDNPINNLDPSGHDLISLSIDEGISASLDSMEGVVDVTAEASEEDTLAAAQFSQQEAEDEALGDSAGQAEEDIAKTSVRQEGQTVRGLIEKAKKLKNLAKNIKVIPMPRAIIPAVCNNIRNAFMQAYSPVLKRVDEETKIKNRENALFRRGPAGVGKSWDEYPFASGTPIPPSERPAVVKRVPWWQNTVQGGIIAGCYRIEKIKERTPYIVVIVP